ncbi:MAG: hypothetical protein F4Z29_13825 [Gemmatimonadetes bacterium]|nr:hypothetical protein [Gemmatimonadota bacterium]
MRSFYVALLSAMVITVGITACGESPTEPVEQEPEDEHEHEHEHDETERPPGELMPTLSSIQSLVFNPSCVSHHGLDDAAAGLNLAEGHSFKNLVNVRSTQVMLDLVRPGDAENSYLIHKLEGREGIEGRQMPLGASPLSAADIAVIKVWINSGAEEDDHH